ncbi:hypothetical protein U1Q18_043293 [Sarracenia purpurea var. burkii]
MLVGQGIAELEETGRPRGGRAGGNWPAKGWPSWRKSIGGRDRPGRLKPRITFGELGWAALGLVGNSAYPFLGRVATNQSS